MSDLITKEMPKVTVTVSTFNGERYIVEAVNSVLNQSYQNLVFTIIDDGSTDQTLPLLRDLAKRDPRLQIIENKVNRGTGYSYAELLKNADGDYIAAIGQDDRWDPDYLELAIERLQQNADASGCFSSVQIIDSNGEIRRPQNSPFLIDFATALSHEDLMCALIRFNFLCAAGAVFRRKFVQDWHTQGDNDQLQDWNTWQRLILKGRFIFLSEKRVSYRIHSNNLSIGGVSPAQAYVEIIQTQISMISSPEFAEFILKSKDPERLFQASMAALSATMNFSDPTHYLLLFQAMKRNEDLLRDLVSYQAFLEMLFQYVGAISKAHQLFSYRKDTLEINPIFWRGFEWRTLFVLCNSATISSDSRFVKAFKKGRFRRLKVFIRKSELPFFNFRIDHQSSTADQLIERFLEDRSLICRKRPGNLNASTFKGGCFVTRS